MADIDESESNLDQSMMMLQSADENTKLKKGDVSNYKIFAQAADKNQKKSQNNSSSNERTSIIQQPNQFPNIKVSGKINESRFLPPNSARSNFSYANGGMPMELSMTSIDNSSRGDNRNYGDQVSLTNESILFDPYSGRAMRPGADMPLRT